MLLGVSLLLYVVGPYCQSFSDLGNLLVWIVLSPEPERRILCLGPFWPEIYLCLKIKMTSGRFIALDEPVATARW